MSRLTDQQIHNICTDPRSAPDVARDYGVSDGLIRQIRLGMIYTDAPRPAVQPERVARGRQPRDHKGEKSPNHVLTDKAVRWLRKHAKKFDRLTYGELAADVAAKFNLRRVPHERTIGLAVQRKTWRHL